MGVEFKRKDYINSLPRWAIVDDTQAGQLTIKTRNKGRDYLPFYGTRPTQRQGDINQESVNAQADLTQQEADRYSNYLKRAIFYNYISRTIGGLVGLATSEPIVYTSDTSMSYAEDNIDGAGTSLSQQMKRATELAVKHARLGVLADFPKTGGTTNQKDVNAGLARAYSSVYRAEQIINWREERFGSETKLALVVLAEIKTVVADDGFELEEVPQFRVLQLTDSVYTQSVIDDKGVVVEGPFTPADSKGNAFDHIPFHFIGAINNDPVIDESILYDMAVINVGHYVNSADYENSAWLVGQPVPWMSGVDQQHINLMGGTPIIGAGALVPVPAGESFGIAQAGPNSLAFEAMMHKQEQLIALGAKAVSSASAFKTATEAAINNTSETSFLQSVMDNVESGYNKLLEDMALFMGGAAEVDNPTDLSILSADPAMLAQVIQSWMGGLTAKEDARAFQRKIGVLERTDEDIDADISSDTSGLLDNVPVVTKTAEGVSDD